MSEYIVCVPRDMPYDIKAELNAWYINSEPIVRCRDCVRYSLDDYGNTWCAYVASAVQPDDFCAWGETKDK